MNKVAANAVPDLAEARPDIEQGEEESIAEDADVDTIREWELDFCSRPMLDGRGKKLWELVVCDSRRQLQFTRFFPNNVINSVTLRDTLLYIMDTLEVPKPEKIRFFRYDPLSATLLCSRFFSTYIFRSLIFFRILPPSSFCL